MKKITIYIVLSICVILIVLIINYYASYFDFKRAYAEWKIERWASMIEGPGRTCFMASVEDVQRVLANQNKSINHVNHEYDSSIAALPIHSCAPRAKLIKMTYYANYNVVSGVYRCKTDDVIQEFQLAIYMEPRIHDTLKDYCVFADFKEGWKVPVGEVTMFSKP